MTQDNAPDSFPENVTSGKTQTQELPTLEHRTILIADDASVNRKMLRKILSPQYAILEAENGEQALELLERYGASISAVILDLIMPVMDGFAFLHAIQKKEAYQNLPIIVATGNGGLESEVDALKLGAWDFITKPYNGEIIQFRLRNAIVRSQLSAFQQLKYLAEFDSLTGIYNKNKFFSATREMLNARPEMQYAFLRLDIDRFQLINSFFGTEEGDKLLRFLADNLKTNYHEGLGVYGRMEGDVFAVCFSYVNPDDVTRCLELSKERVKAYNPNFDIVPIFGLYYLDDLSLPVSEMLDRATLAAKTCKGSYLNTIAIYRPELSRKLEKEQEIINEMAPALEQGQYIVYLQPKYSLATERPIGAEALVRWLHPVKGLISPGEFIPVFEKNGFISKVDYYVWEKVCLLLKDWLEQGITPLPISVNVSRANLYNPNLVSLITELVKKYNIPPRLMELELTESAYMDNPQMMEQVVGQLHQAGFTILMDDFGSGYSSLSVLKDVAVDVIKIDMRFFDKTRVSGRGENIIASIVRMAKWLNLPVTAEGVETREQADFLRGVGCDNVQGFYYAKPMPVDQYVRLIREAKNEIRPVGIQRYSGLNIDRLWGLDPEMLLLFSDDPSPKAIYEFDGENIELLRVNKAFKDLFGFGNSAADMTPLNFVMPQYHQTVIEACLCSVKDQSVTECEYQRNTADGRLLWVKLTLQYVQKVGNKHILMGHMEDVTRLKALQKVKDAAPLCIADGKEISLAGAISLMNMRHLLTYLSQIFDVARLVDPENTALVELTEQNQIVLKPYSCFSVWKYSTRCENCTSICAMRNNCRMTKYEFIQNDIFYVVSNPILLEDSMGRHRPLALELVSHISDHLSMTKVGGKTLSEWIEETQRKIYTDALTGAYNRRYLSELLFSHHRQNGVATMLGLVLLDLKNFKRINDYYGHETGDKLLSETAEKLRDAVRMNDTVIRYGGDEFVVTLLDCAEVQVRSAIERMREALHAIRFGPEGKERIEADFGYAYTSKLDLTYGAIEKMLRAADESMYREKRKSREIALQE